jgi:hypothetical protein
MEGPVQAKTRIDVPRELVGLGNYGFKGCTNERVAVGLTAG